MPDITEELEQATSEEEKVKIINSIDNRYGNLRQKSKAPTFALTYGGSYKTLMNNCGFSEDEAKNIEHAYHELYSVSDKWVQDKIAQARLDGYVNVAFGLKLRTPLLKQSVGQLSSIASAEARTAGNALGQGWGMLNCRAMSKVLEQVDKLGLSEDILPIAKIHDATYYLVRNDINTIALLNKLAVEQAHWNHHPDIYHPDVGLGGQLDLFYPDWAHPITLPEHCNEDCLIKTVENYLND